MEFLFFLFDQYKEELPNSVTRRVSSQFSGQQYIKVPRLLLIDVLSPLVDNVNINEGLFYELFRKIINTKKEYIYISAQDNIHVVLWFKNLNLEIPGWIPKSYTIKQGGRKFAFNWSTVCGSMIPEKYHTFFITILLSK